MLENALRHEPIPVESPPGAGLHVHMPASVPARVRLDGWFALAMPWLVASVVAVAVAFYFAYGTFDLRQYQLQESGMPFDTGLGHLVGGAERLTVHADAGSRLVERPDGTAAGGERSSARTALARTQVQRVSDVVSLRERQTRTPQATTAAFLDELDAGPAQLVFAFAAIVTLLVLAIGFCVQWVMVARRERAIRGRAEHLAEVAEAERRRAEEVARDKARFLGMLSHELLTPLQSIWSTMDVIESRGRVDAHDAAFARLRESTRSLRGRISDLVDFAKMSSGRLEARVRSFQFDTLVDAALRDVEEALAAKNLDVHWEPAPDLARRIYSDPARLRQIVDNLLSNAVKYTERGGITITAQLLHQTSLLRFEISDTGVGIQPDALERLFEPFYRAPATAAMAEGSGLGLAVVRSLVDLMGGDIHVQSQVGQGTVMVVEVPVAECQDGLIDAPRQLDAQLPVLVVDDSRDARRAIADVIRSLGFDVYEAGGGMPGLAEAALRNYHAILLDLQMPDLDGYQVALRLRESGSRHAHTFIALVSACDNLDDASADGVFDARIDKPVSRRDLVAALVRAGAHGEAAKARSDGAAIRGEGDDVDALHGSRATDARRDPRPPAPTG